MYWQEILDHKLYLNSGKTYDVDIRDFALILDLPSPPFYVDQSRLLKHWYITWICTDTRVGLAVYTLDGVPVAVSTQQARKSEEEIEMISAQAVLNVSDYIMELTPPPQVAMADLTTPLSQDWWEHK
jgi:hypothetical protein